MKHKKNKIKILAIASALLAIMASPISVFALHSANHSVATTKTHEGPTTWPDGSQLVISFSMQFENGGIPNKGDGIESPFAAMPLPAGQPDITARSWFNYGSNEGMWRMMDLWDQHGIKVTSHVIGEAALVFPEVVEAIHDRGHEVTARGFQWKSQAEMSFEEELAFVKRGIAAVDETLGIPSRGFNAHWCRRSPHTLKVLQAAGMNYQVDDFSRDEPFVVMVRGEKFAIVPYTLRNNDIVLFSNRSFSPQQFLDLLKFEFDRLYKEGATKRRMMSVTLHDRIGGSPAIVEAVDRFIEYAKSHQKVTFMRKDEIANIVLNEANPLIDTYEDEFNRL